MTADERRSPVPLVARPEGGWQFGVGPGALVLRTADGVDQRALQVLAPALAGLGQDVSDDIPAGETPLCPVVGSGPLAARLRRALGGLDDDTSAQIHVAVHHNVVPVEVGIALARTSRVTVPVVVQPWRVLVGPVTGPPGSPCLHCLDLHRRDRDDAWPVLVSALGHPAEQVARTCVPEALAVAAQGLTTLLVTSLLTGRAVSPGLGYELGTRAPHVVARRWSMHPRCPWHA